MKWFSYVWYSPENMNFWWCWFVVACTGLFVLFIYLIWFKIYRRVDRLFLQVPRHFSSVSSTDDCYLFLCYFFVYDKWLTKQMILNDVSTTTHVLQTQKKYITLFGLVQFTTKICRAPARGPTRDYSILWGLYCTFFSLHLHEEPAALSESF